jgi:hypothetical protein
MCRPVGHEKPLPLFDTSDKSDQRTMSVHDKGLCILLESRALGARSVSEYSRLRC